MDKKDDIEIIKEENKNTNTENEIEINPEEVTREINLDDLYDGAVNNTVLMDPITNNEILLAQKKPNFKFLGVILAIIILLLLYYINNKTDLFGMTKEVEAKQTTTKITTKQVTDKGQLTCSYSSKSDAETQNVTFVANYLSNEVTDTEFNYVVVSNTDSTSAVIDDLKSQYESFYINNVAVVGNNVSFEKNDKGFTFNIKTNYKVSGYENIVINEGQTILFSKPTIEDKVDSLKNIYTEKGFTCALAYDED